MKNLIAAISALLAASFVCGSAMAFPAGSAKGVYAPGALVKVRHRHPRARPCEYLRYRQCDVRYHPLVTGYGYYTPFTYYSCYNCVGCPTCFRFSYDADASPVDNFLAGVFHPWPW